MIIVKIELHSARTGRVTEIGRMHVSNVGTGSLTRGDYRVEVMRRGTTDRVQRGAHVANYPRNSYSVWELIRRALHAALDKHPLPAESTAYELCWHCHDCLEPSGPPRCESCPAYGDCDLFECDQPGCRAEVSE